MLIRDRADNILIVKPTYRSDWLLPGGSVEENESPRQDCFRELHEEIGIRMPLLWQLCVDYTSPDGEKTEALQFVHNGDAIDRKTVNFG